MGKRFEIEKKDVYVVTIFLKDKDEEGEDLNWSNSSEEYYANTYEEAQKMKEKFMSGQHEYYGDLIEDCFISDEMEEREFYVPVKYEKRLFVDMDGTLAVFTPVDELETLYEQGYFLNLQPHENVVAAIKEIITKHPEIEVSILSAYLSDSKYALAEKNQWLDKYLPEIDSKHRVFVPCGTDKKEGIPNKIRKDDFLLDDYTKNLNDWQPPARGIKLLNGINHTRGTWPHDRIRHDRGVEELAEGILSIMRDEKQIYDQKKPSLLDNLHKKQEQVKAAEDKKKDISSDNRNIREKDLRSER